MQDFYSLTKNEFDDICKERSIAPQHSNTIFKELYKNFNSRPWTGLQVPKALQKILQEDYSFPLPVRAKKESISAYDGTVKFLVELNDGSLVESVLMPERNRITVCLSSQVGCAQACSFCHTGRMGLKRQLSAGEIVGQVQMANKWLMDHPEWKEKRGYPKKQKVTNVVFMGMGEPLDNTDNVVSSANIYRAFWLTDSSQKLSVSTAGHLDGIKQLLSEFPGVALALSLHATTEGEKSAYAINRRWSMAEVLTYLKSKYETDFQGATVLIQYTVINNVNDSREHATKLAELLKDMPVKLNLIPFNDVAPSAFNSPLPERLEAFKTAIHNAGIRVMVRYSKGQDIDAACGQLVTKEKNELKTKLIS